MADDRLFQVAVEILVEPTSAKVRVGAVAVETIVGPGPASVRLSAVVVETAVLPIGVTKTQLASIAVETLLTRQAQFLAAAADFSGTGSFGAHGGLPVPGALVLAGTGSYELSPGIQSGFIELIGEVTLETSATQSHAAAADLTGLGLFAPDTRTFQSGTLELTGTGTLLPLGSTDDFSPLFLSGVGTFTSRVPQAHDGALDITGLGTLSGAPVLAILSSGVDLLGEGFFEPTGERIFYIPTPPGLPPGSIPGGVPAISKVVIKVNGVDVTDVVRYRDATFISQANGVAGECSFAVRDLAHTRGFTFGQTVTVDINDRRQWTGFIAQIKRQYSLPVVDTTNPQKTARWFLIKGFDINILFQKRIVWNKAKPTQGELSPPGSLRDPKHSDYWMEDAPAKDVVRYTVTNYTDLLSDGISLSGVVIDGTPNPDFPGPYSGAVTLGDFMHDVNILLNGIYYISPDKRLCYHDVEHTTTPYIITDSPSGTYEVGPRNFTLMSDAGAMINDALVWSTALGFSGITFARVTDAAAIAAHGRQQYGEFITNMYKQASVNHRADSLVNGNTASRIAPKHDRIMASATVFESLFDLGDVLLVRQRVFDGSQDPPFSTSAAYVEIVLPIRRITMTFPGPNSVKYDLLITQELDEPWNIYESIWPGFPGFDFGPPVWPPPLCPDGTMPPCLPPPPPLCPDGTPPPCLPPPPDCIEAIFSADEFNRTVSRIGPFVTTTSLWGGLWTNVVNEITGDLYFPGDIAARHDETGNLNKVSPFIPDNTVVHINFISHNSGGGPALNTHGVFGVGLNTWRGVQTGPYSVNTASASTNNNYVYYFFNNVYNPLLTGSGTFSYIPPTFGNAANSVAVNTTTRRGSVVVNNTEFGQRLVYAPTAAVNRDSVSGRFEFWLGALPSSAEWFIEYGAVTVEFDPAVNLIRIITSSGTVNQPWTDWHVSTTDPPFVLETTLDLANDYVRVRLSRAGGGAIEVETTTAGERVGDADYRPEIEIYWRNLTATDFRWEMAALRLSVWENAASSTPSIFDFTDASWVEYSSTTTAGNDPGLNYAADGTVSRITSLATGGHIRKNFSGGGISLGFCISNYSASMFKPQILSLFFGLNTAGLRRHVAFIGNNPSVTVGEAPGNGAVGAANTLFTAGSPVNVRVDFNGGGMRLKQWAGGTAEPATWTVEFYRTLTPWPDVFLGIFGSGFGSAENESFKLGPLQLTGGSTSPDYLITGSPSMAAPGLPPAPTTTTPAYARYRSWPFIQPPGSWAVVFGTDQYTAISRSVPTYAVRLVWPVFGPTPGSGIPHAIEQWLGSVQFAPKTQEDAQLEYNIRVRGTATITLGEALYGGVGATGIPGRVNVIIENFSYGKGPAINGGVADPPYVDYNILNGTDKWNAIFDQVTISRDQSIDFNVLMTPYVDELGVRHLQWGVYFHGIDESTVEAVEKSGPLWGGAFGQPNRGTMQVGLSNVTYELVPFTSYFPVGDSRNDPCPPPTFGGSTGEGGATGCTPGFFCETLAHTGGNTFSTSCNFGAGPIEVYLNGELLFPDTYEAVNSTIHLDATIATNASLRVCYNALSSRTGGGA